MRCLIPAAFLAADAAAAPARQDSLIIALAGAEPQAVVRFDGGRWVPSAGPLTCAAAGAADRVVVSGGAAELPREIPPTAEDWKAIEGAIVRLAERREREHDLSAPTLARVSVGVDRVYAAPSQDGVTVYYFEASRRVPDPGTAPEEPTGTLRIALSGWLQVAAANTIVLGSKSELGWQEDKPALQRAARQPALVPLAVVRHRGQWIWVMKGGTGDIRWIVPYLVSEAGVQALADPVRCAR